VGLFTLAQNYQVRCFVESQSFARAGSSAMGSKAVLAAPTRHFRITPRNGHRQTAAISRHESPTSPSYLLLGQQVMIEIASRWRRVWLQLNACYTHVAAIQCRISDPSPQVLVTAHGATNFQPKVPGICINKPGEIPRFRP
jgi:hypothetical protein